MSAIKRFLIDPEVDLNWTDASRGESQLFQAITHNPDVAILLLNFSELDITHKSKDGKTVFSHACSCCKYDSDNTRSREKLVTLLLSLLRQQQQQQQHLTLAEVSLTVLTPSTYQALSLTLDNYCYLEMDSQNHGPLYHACKAGNFNVVRQLLAQPGIEGTINSNVHSPLVRSYELARDRYPNSGEYSRITRLLFDDPRFDINAKDKQQTLLHHACRHGDVDFVG